MQQLSTYVRLRTEPLNTWSQYWELKWEINKSSPRIRDVSTPRPGTGAQRGVWRRGAPRAGMGTQRGVWRHGAPLAGTGAQRGVWRRGALGYAAAALKNHPALLQGLSTELPQDPAVPLLGIQPREMKTHVCTRICPWIFIVALFIITKQQKQPKCSPPDERINEMCLSHATSYCSVIEWGLIQAIRRVNFGNSLLRKHWLWSQS